MSQYPKMLYRGGKPYGDDGRRVGPDDTRTVVNGVEERDAKDDGFEAAYQGEPHAPPADPVASAFDHDGDGHPGGAPKGGNRRKKKQA